MVIFQVVMHYIVLLAESSGIEYLIVFIVITFAVLLSLVFFGIIKRKNRKN